MLFDLTITSRGMRDEPLVEPMCSGWSSPTWSGMISRWIPAQLRALSDQLRLCEWGSYAIFVLACHALWADMCILQQPCNIFCLCLMVGFSGKLLFQRQTFFSGKLLHFELFQRQTCFSEQTRRFSRFSAANFFFSGGIRGTYKWLISQPAGLISDL